MWNPTLYCRLYIVKKVFQASLEIPPFDLRRRKLLTRSRHELAHSQLHLIASGLGSSAGPVPTVPFEHDKDA